MRTGSEREDRSAPDFSYSEKFEELCPYYMSIGMTYAEYWDGDPEMARYYRKTEELNRERRNQELWLQGVYIYEALCDVAPVLHAFAKKGTKPAPFTTTPYPLTEKQRKENEERKARERRDKGLRYMQALMAQTNRKFTTGGEQK